MKQRFSYLDLRLVVNELKPELENSRLQNIYVTEASARHFIFKFDTKSDQKIFFIVDPGMRLHRTKFEHATTQMPSGFVAKLRKHLRNLWVSNLWVPEGNRLLVITFGDNYYKLVFEFFAGGNIVLLDKEGKIIALMRVVKNMAGEITYGVGKQLEIQDKPTTLPSEQDIEAIIGKDKIGRAVHAKLNASLSMVEYCLQKHGVDPKSKQGDVAAILAAIKECAEWFNELVQQPKVPGYIMVDEKDQSQEFEPFKQYFEQVKHDNWQIKTCETYNKTVDEYYGAILAGKQESQFDQIHKVAETRLEAARNERANRLRGLETVQQQNEAMGVVLQTHADLVDAAIKAVNELVAQSLDWGDIDNIIQMEKAKGNPVAKPIHRLKLDDNAMVLVLEEDSEEEEQLQIKVKLSQGAWANARDYFEVKRSAGAKKEKTELAAQKALASAEKKIKKDLEKSLAKSTNKTRTLNVRRNQFWFEKFYWFLTSDGYICIGGRDALQNELLLTRYFTQGDYYVHCDIEGASVVLIKNPSQREMSPKALNESAAFTVATSRAWDTKSPGAAWYISRDKVPRLNKAGNPISSCEVALLKRQVILPNQFDVGFGLLWDKDGVVDSDEEIDLSEEEFPDTEILSDEEFPDTEILSDEEGVEEQSEAESEAEPETEPEAEEPGPKGAEAEAKAEAEAESEAESEENHDKTEAVEVPAGPGSEGASHSSSPDSSPLASPSASPAPTSAAKPKRVRGNKKKLKKYAQQDEDDRQEAMQRLGTFKGLERQEAERLQKQQEKEREQQIKKQRQERARQADLKRINAEVVEETPFPTSLTFKAEGDLKNAVPMFGPWASMSSTDFRVKLVPGQLKKGKATSEVQRALLDKTKDAKLKQLIEAIPNTDMQQILPMSRVQLAVAKAKGRPGRGQKKK